ncbi:MAG: hypothetical protein ABR585_11895 [Gemmatimonadaceae bacterium]
MVAGCVANQSAQSRGTINEPFTVNGVRVEPDSLNTYLAAHKGFTSRGGEMRCVYRPLGQSGTKVFVWAVCGELLAVDGDLVEGSGMSVPAAFDIRVDNSKARVTRVEVPEDGSGYGSSIQRIFPASIWPAIFPSGSQDQPAAGLGNELRLEAAARFRLSPSAASAPRRHFEDLTNPRNPAVANRLDSAARRIVGFLRGEQTFDQIALSDSVTLYVSPEGGGGQRTLSREQLRRASAWRVSSGRREIAFAPPAGMTKLTTKVGRHFNCTEQMLGPKFPRLGRYPHVGTMLEPQNTQSCLRKWNVTFVFDRSTPPRLVAAVYDQWEW